MMGLMLLVAGCAGFAAQQRLSEFDTLSRAYARSLRWSDFEAAYALTHPPAAANTPDFRRLKNVRVTLYEAASQPPDAAGTEIERVAQIKYVWLNAMIERELTQRERWVYSESERRWYLAAGFPEFR